MAVLQKKRRKGSVARNKRETKQAWIPLIVEFRQQLQISFFFATQAK